MNTNIVKIATNVQTVRSETAQIYRESQVDVWEIEEVSIDFDEGEEVLFSPELFATE